MASPSAEICAAIEYPASRLAGEALEPTPLAAEIGRGFNDRHKLLDILPVIARPAGAINQSNSTLQRLKADRACLVAAPRPRQR